MRYMFSVQKKFFLIVIGLITVSVIVVFVGWILGGQFTQRQQAQNSSPLPLIPHASSTSAIQASSTNGIKIYTNIEFSFEFQYPENWSFHVGTFYSPFSKFNLVGAPLGEDYQLDPPMLINIVTPDFADRAIISRQNLGATKSEILVGDIRGIKYEYTEDIPRISIDLPFGKYRMILGAHKDYENIFNQSISTFKLLK